MDFVCQFVNYRTVLFWLTHTRRTLILYGRIRDFIRIRVDSAETQSGMTVYVPKESLFTWIGKRTLLFQ